MTLHDRLSRIKTLEKRGLAGKASGETGFTHLQSLPGWTETGFNTAKRTVSLPFCGLSYEKNERFLSFPPNLAFFVPALESLVTGKTQASSLLFFDLETTGLSGGAGTVAFLAAFGRLRGERTLEVTQHLLLDYPGEAAFLENALSEFTSTPDVTAVTFNGKTFDAQILRTRCLMNALPMPDFAHADLLHISRRLWRGVLPSCGQAVIEEAVLGLSRAGDLGGAEAPDAWFRFLRTGDSGKLSQIADHNLRDISGLAALLAALSEIAAFPADAPARWKAHPERLGLFLYRGFREKGEETPNYVLALLEQAARADGWRAAHRLARHSEWRLGNYEAALFWVQNALEHAPEDAPAFSALLRAKKRLKKRLVRVRETFNRTVTYEKQMLLPNRNEQGLSITCD